MLTFPDIFFPGAAGNWQEIMTRWWSPNIAFNFAGNASIEREVTEDVASYGRQIGWLNDVVAALAKDSAAVKDDAKAKQAYKALMEARDKIEAIKQRRQRSALDNAREALAKLAAADNGAYSHLVRSLDPDQPPALS
jgi:hypothetical protein